MRPRHLSRVLPLSILVVLVSCEGTSEVERRNPPRGTVAASSEPSIDGEIELGFQPHALALDGDTVWVVGAHGAIRFSAETGAPAGDVIEVSRSLVSAVAHEGSLWAVGGGDGHVPHGKLLRIDGTGVRDRIPVTGSPYDVVFAHGSLWIADASGQVVTIVDPATGRKEVTPVVGEFLVGMAAGGGRIWALSSGSGGRSFTPIRPIALSAGAQRRAGRCPTDIAVGRGAVWVSDFCRGVVREFTPRGDLQDVLKVGHRPMAIDLHGGDLWVANYGDGTVTRIPLGDRAHPTVMKVGEEPADLLISGGYVWVANSGSGSLTRVPIPTGGS
jgi:DNA-binding beta-propeller fold protein YncE